MVTNQIITRKMGNFDVHQRTSDGYFDGNALLSQWNKSNEKKKVVSEFMRTSNADIFINELKNNFSHSDNYRKADYQVFIHTKGRMTKEGRTPDKAWMHPLLFIKFAMWINPTFELQVLKFVYDEMIKYRNLAGDAYKEMGEKVYPILLEEFGKEHAVKKLTDLAKTLNIIVFGRHEKELRNKDMFEEKSRELYDLEKQIAQWISLGLVNNYEQLKNALIRLNAKNLPL